MRFHEIINMIGVVEERTEDTATLLLRVGQTTLIKFKEYDLEHFKLIKKFAISKAAAQAFAIYRRNNGFSYFAEGNTVRNAENGDKYNLRYDSKLLKIQVVKEGL